MRQAYDYWQNQPGNYLNRETTPPRRAKGHRRPSMKRGSGLVNRSGHGPKPNAQPRPPPGPKPPEASTGYPIAPTELPKEWSAATLGMHGPKTGPRCAIHPSEGGYQPPVTPGGGYGLRLTPKCLQDSDSHRPFIHRLRQSSRGEPHESSGHPNPVAVPGGSRPSGPTAAGWGDAPPEPEPTATWNGPRCTENSAHGWRSSGYETRLGCALLLQGWSPSC